MDVVIISSSPRTVLQSHSARYSLALSEGISQTGGNVQIFYLSDRSSWHSAVTAITKGAHTLFIIPVYSGSVSGVFLEFLKTLSEHTDVASKHTVQKSMAFVVHGGLPGRGDFDCCRRFLIMVPGMLRFRFSGIIGIADTTIKDFVEQEQTKTLQRLRDMGAEFVENAYCFSLPEAFWGPDDLPGSEAEAYCRFVNRFCRHISAAQGCEVPLDYAPYSEEIT